jgi:hypothetical protein
LQGYLVGSRFGTNSSLGSTPLNERLAATAWIRCSDSPRSQLLHFPGRMNPKIDTYRAEVIDAVTARVIDRRAELRERNDSQTAHVSNAVLKHCSETSQWVALKLETKSVMGVLAWGARGPGFKSRQPDQLSRCSFRHLAAGNRFHAAKCSRAEFSRGFPK